MNLKESIEKQSFMVGILKVIGIDVLDSILDSYTSELIAEMEKMKHQQCLKNRCVHNDAISACQKIMEEKNG